VKNVRKRGKLGAPALPNIPGNGDFFPSIFEVWNDVSRPFESHKIDEISVIRYPSRRVTDFGLRRPVLARNPG
jgi:hypothetical protein